MCQSFKDKVAKANQGFENIPKFLKIVYQILDEGKYEDYISWSHDGRAIVIKKPIEFAEKLLPIYFKHSNYSSFVRQLNLYSFRKKKHYPYDNAFAHTMFLKGRMDLLRYVKRKNSTLGQPEKGSRVEFSSDEDTEYDELLKQNSNLKKVHQDMADKLQSFEEKLQKLQDDNERLHQQQHRRRTNEDFLKTIIVKIAKSHGTGTIRDLINSVVNEEKTHTSSRLAMIPPIEPETELGYPIYDNARLYRKDPYSFQGQLDNEAELSGSKISMVKNDPNYFNSTGMRTISTASTMPDTSDIANTYYGFAQNFDNNMLPPAQHNKIFEKQEHFFGDELPSFPEQNREYFNTGMIDCSKGLNLYDNMPFDYKPSMLDAFPSVNNMESFFSK